MADQLLVDVSYRDILLFSRAVIDGVEAQGGFMPTSAPMPVGSELKLRSLHDADITVTARVKAIVETRRKMRKEGEIPGMQVAFVDDAAALLEQVENVEVEAATGAAPGAAAQTTVIAVAPVVIEAPISSGGMDAMASGEIRAIDATAAVAEAEASANAESPDKVVIEVDAAPAKTGEVTTPAIELEADEPQNQSTVEAAAETAAEEPSESAPVEATVEAPAADDSRSKKKKRKRKKKK